MITINSQILKNIFDEHKTEFDSIIASKKMEVIDLFHNPTYISKGKKKKLSLTRVSRVYLLNLIDNFENIVMANSTELHNHKNKFDSIICPSVMKSNTYKLFRNELLRRMGYKDLRNDTYTWYFEKVGIKACVYCNSQLTITVLNVKRKKVAKFQVDHFISKDKYPCFSISFYNLYPVCGPCNNVKSSRNSVVFNLYSDNYIDYKSSLFRFALDKKSLVKYRVNGNESEIIIKFHEPLGSNFEKTFAIEGIYNTQRDIAEELIIKSIIYSKSYLESLKQSLKSLYKHKAPMLERLLIGNYIEERDIHKRPMAKFTMDIARQLKLIS